MATTYKATREQSGVEPIYNVAGVVAVVSSYTFAAALVINDLINVCEVPANSKVVGYYVDVPSTGMDTATALVWALGDTTTANLYITGSTVGRSSAGGIVGPGSTGSQPGSLSVDYTVQTTIQFKCTTAPTTGVASGTITFVILYTCQQDVV